MKRGAAHNPDNRFDKISYAPDPDEAASASGRRTEFFRDRARSVITRNDSPDVGFGASLNPYRGCEHGCSYCLSGDTRILMADGSVKPLEEVRVGDPILGTERRGRDRHYVKTGVLAHWKTRKPAYRVRLADGTELVASGDHRFLTERGWKHVAPGGGIRRESLTTNDSLRGFGRIAESRAPHTGAYRRGERSIEGQAVESAAGLRVVAVESFGRDLPLFDITTGTGDFIADGVVSHNCYARPTHEYLGFSAGLDFETRILVKEDAPALLRAELAAPSWEPQPLVLSGVTDPYQPVEKRLRVTRRCLEVLADARHPVAVITKNHLVTRDADLLAELARHRACAVNLSITTLDPDLAGRLEPRASRPALRLEAIARLRDAGVPAGVMVAPVIPGLTDEEAPSILKAAADAGAQWAGYTVLRLPYAVKDVFDDWLERHAPDRKAKILARLRSLRGGRLNDPDFHSRMRGRGPFADQIADLFRIARRKAGIPEDRPELSAESFRAPGCLF